MAFFTNELASTMQYISFPLEVTGLILATIEVRYPQTAILITAKFSREWKKIVDDLVKESEIPEPKSGTGVLKVAIAKFNHGIYLHPVLFIAAVLLLTLIVGGFGTYITLQLLGFENVDYWTIVVDTIVYASANFIISIIVIGILPLVLWTSLKWVKGREIGTLGIIIAGFGVLGEAYQFTTQLVI